jgi:hypothetical protein
MKVDDKDAGLTFVRIVIAPLPDKGGDFNDAMKAVADLNARRKSDLAKRDLSTTLARKGCSSCDGALDEGGFCWACGEQNVPKALCA